MRGAETGEPGSSGMISEKEKRRTDKPKKAVKKEKAKFSLAGRAEESSGWKPEGAGPRDTGPRKRQLGALQLDDQNKRV